MKISTILDQFDCGHMAFSCFTDGDSFRRYVVAEVLGGDNHA